MLFPQCFSGKRKGGTLEVPRKERRRKCRQRCEGKRAVIDKLETDLQNKNAQLKDLTENVEYLEKEKQDRQQEVASASMGDKHVCFSAENFRNQDKLIQFYTGIVNWNVFLRLFNFIEDRCKAEILEVRCQGG